METPLPQLEERACSHCGALIAADAQRCYLCEHDFSQVALEAPVVPAPITFSLSTLFLFMTLCAVWAGITALAWPLGILFLIVCVPALYRTRTLVADWEKRTHAPASALEKTVQFLAALAMLLICIIVSIIAAGFTSAVFLAVGRSMQWLAHEANPPWQSLFQLISGSCFWAGTLGAVAAAIACGVFMLRVLWSPSEQDGSG
jgi:hypothetical protein